MIDPKIKRMMRKAGLVQHFDVGDDVRHPDGYMVRITAGQYWGQDGVSNFWYWRRYLKNGQLSQKEYCGYGWTPSKE
jgi:hypothetical protein